MFSKIPWLSLGRFALVVLCLVLVLALVITVLPIYLDITAFKGPVENLLSSVAEATVTVDEIHLHPSLWPTLRVSGLEVAGSSAEESAPLARIDAAEIKLSLLPLLSQELRIKRLIVSGGHVHIARSDEQSDSGPISIATAWKIEELAGIEIENVSVQLVDDQTARTSAIVNRLTCDIAASRPLDVRLDGSLEGMPLSVSAGGPTLAALSQATDFPISIELTLADLELGLEGDASREPEGTKFRVAFDLQSRELAFLRALGVDDLPGVGEVRLSGQISNRNAGFEVSDLQGSIGSSNIYGNAALDLTEAKPEVSGRLSLGQLDLEPWLGSSDSAESDTNTPLPFSILSTANVHLKLRLEELNGLAIEVRDFEAEVTVEDGVLSVPATLNAAGIPVSGTLEVRADQDMPELSSRLRAQDLTLNQFDKFFEVPEGLDGQLGALELNLSSSGDSVDVLSANLSVEAIARQALVSVEGEGNETSVEVILHQVRGEYTPDQPLTATAEGQLLEETFTLDLETSTLANLIEDDAWPLSLRLMGAGADMNLAGDLERGADGLDLNLEFALSGDRLGDLESWLSLPPRADLSYELQGRLETAASARLLSLHPSSIGSTRFSGEFAWSTENEPFMVTLHADDLDLVELRDLSSSVTELDTEQEVIAVDVPILPSRKSFHDAEIDLTVDRLRRDTVNLTNISATLNFQQGRLERSPFSFEYDTQSFDGELSLDLRENIPRFALELHGDGEDLGEILEQEGFVEGFAVVAEKLDLRIDASGSSVRELVRSADLSGQLVDVRWRIQPPEFEEPVIVRLERVDLHGPKGEPIVLTAKGTLDQEPLDLRLTLRYPEDPLEHRDQSIPFDAALGLAATEIALKGDVELPIKEGAFEMRMVAQGATLATLSNVVDTDLPDLGPYRVEGRLTAGDGGFSFEELDLALGDSDLRGEIQYKRVDDRPTVTADLTSQLLRTEDFLQPSQEPEGGEQGVGVAEQAVDKTTEALSLTLEKLKGLDATLDLQVLQLESFGGPMDNLIVDADLARGELDFSMRRPQESAEDARLVARIRPRPQGLQVALLANWDRQPYGLLADFRSSGNAQGSWGVDLDLESRGSTVEELAANLSGHLYYVDYPDELSATAFDLWGGGLINSLRPVFNLGTESRVNCAVAKFQVERGVLTSELLVVDSTRSRVRGKGTIDLPADKLNLRLKPRPKQRNLINLSTPVKISGSLTDPNVHIATGGLAVTFFRLSLWVYTVWRDMVRKPLPADGHDVCVDPFVAPKKK